MHDTIFSKVEQRRYDLLEVMLDLIEFEPTLLLQNPCKVFAGKLRDQDYLVRGLDVVAQLDDVLMLKLFKDFDLAPKTFHISFAFGLAGDELHG